MDWFLSTQRDLPWRRKPNNQFRRDPYSTWISEVMLQQTQVAAVIPHFERWMKSFPNLESLAQASEARVLQEWAGLGYYRRAKNLRLGAQQVIKRGSFPENVEGWKALPGIGDYTAGAITSLAFNYSDPILDGNIIRVFSRFLGLGYLPQNGVPQREIYWSLSRIWALSKTPGDANEGLMELGALICSPRNPRCSICPLGPRCKAEKNGWQIELPPDKPKPVIELISGQALVVTCKDLVFLETRPKDGILSGHFLFPLFLDNAKISAPLKRGKSSNFEHKEKKQSQNTKIRHAIMNQRFLIEVEYLKVAHKKQWIAPMGCDGIWVPIKNLEKRFTNSLSMKIWKAALNQM